MNTFSKSIFISFLTILAGCATPSATVPVLQSCVKEAPIMPATVSEKEILAMDDYAATITVWTERLLLKAFALKAESVIAACK